MVTILRKCVVKDVEKLMIPIRKQETVRNTSTFDQQLRNRPTNVDRQLCRMRVVPTSFGSDVLMAFESSTRLDGRSGGEAVSSNAGPRPPRGWTRSTVEFCAGKTKGSAEWTPASLVERAAFVVASTSLCHPDDRHMTDIGRLPEHLKLVLLRSHSILVQNDGQRRLSSQILSQYFRSPRMSTLLLAYTDIDLHTLSLFLPKQSLVVHTKRSQKESTLLRDSWDDDSSDDDTCISTQNEELLHSAVHSIDISNTRLNDSQRLFKIMYSSVPMLHSLSFAGCFDEQEGPQFLHLVAYNFHQLEYLDISRNEWVDSSVIESLTLPRLMTKLRVFVAVSVACSATFLKSHFKRQRPSVIVVC